MFRLFLKITADFPQSQCSVSAASTSGCFTAYWKQAYVTSIPKGPPSTSVVNYRPISITSILSNEFERLVSVGSSQTISGMHGCVPTTQFA